MQNMNTSLSHSSQNRGLAAAEYKSTNKYKTITAQSNHRLMQHKQQPAGADPRESRHQQLQPNQLFTYGSSLEESWEQANSSGKAAAPNGPPVPQEYPVLKRQSLPSACGMRSSQSSEPRRLENSGSTAQHRPEHQKSYNGKGVINDSLVNEADSSILTQQPKPVNHFHRASSYDDAKRNARQLRRQMDEAIRLSKETKKKSRAAQASFGIELQDQRHRSPQHLLPYSRASRESLVSISSGGHTRKQSRSAMVTGQRLQYHQSSAIGDKPGAQADHINKVQRSSYQKHRTISPVLQTASTALRQPLNFIKQANSGGSISPNLNRSREHQDHEIRSRGSASREQNQYSQPYQRMAVSSSNVAEQRLHNPGDSLNLHINNTGFFPGRVTHNNSLNMSRGGQDQRHGRDLHQRAIGQQRGSLGGAVGLNSNDRSQLLSSIEHVVSGDQNATLAGTPLNISNCYSPSHQQHSLQLDRNFQSLDKMPLHQAHYAKQAGELTAMEFPTDVFNDTTDIDRSYAQLSSQLRDQQSHQRKQQDLNGSMPNQMRSSHLQSVASDAHRGRPEPFTMKLYPNNTGESSCRSKQARERRSSLRQKSLNKNDQRTPTRPKSRKSTIRSESNKKHLHTREISFQQLQFNRGVAVSNSPKNEGIPSGQGQRRKISKGAHIYDYQGSPPIRHLDEFGKQYKDTTQSFSNSEGGHFMKSHKSSHRSRSADFNLNREPGSSKALSLQKVNHFRPQNRDQAFILDFDENSIQREKVTSQHSQNHPYQRNARSEEDRDAQSTSKAASPRFSQNEDLHLKAHMNIMDMSRDQSADKPQLASYVTPNDSQIDHQQMQEMTQNDNSRAAQFDEEMPMHNSQPQLQNMHFNTEDLIKMTQQTLDNYKLQLQHEHGQRQGQSFQNRNHPEQNGAIRITEMLANTQNGWGSEFQDSQILNAQGMVNQTPKVYDNEQYTRNHDTNLASNDDTFRGENFIQQSFRDGLGSIGTRGSFDSRPNEGVHMQRVDQAAPRMIHQQCSKDSSRSPERRCSNPDSGKLAEPLNINTKTGHAGHGELHAAGGSATVIEEANKAGVAARNYSKHAHALENENSFLGQQNQLLNQRFTSLKFTELVEKLWQKQKLSKVHENLTQAYQIMLQSTGKQQRVDAYCTHTNYESLNHVDLMGQIKQLSKRVLAEAMSQQNTQRHNASRGLSKLSEIDSTFQISKVSPREAQFKSLNSTQAFGAQQQKQMANNAGFRNQERTLNNYASSSTFHSKVDIEHLQEMELQMQQMQQAKDESDTIINNLRKTQKELLKQIKTLENKMQTLDAGHGIQYTPSLSNISPRCKSEVGKGSKSQLHYNQQQMKFLESQLAVRESSSQVLRHELGDKESIISDLKGKHEKFTKDMKETFRSKLEEQNNLIDELKTELESSIARNQEYHSSLSNGNQEIKQLKDKLQNQTEEKQRLDNQVQTLGRQMNMLKNQVQSDKSMHDADERRLQNARDQEKHWKQGYETIFSKYSKLKDQMAAKDEQMRQLENENERKLKNITRKAEDAIRYFKKIAIAQVGKDNVPEYNHSDIAQRQSTAQMDYKNRIPMPERAFELHEAEPRMSRFSRKLETESKNSCYDTYQYRSKSMNSPLGMNQYQRHTAQTMMRPGQATPPREYSHMQTCNSNIKNEGASDSNYNFRRRSFSPIRVQLDGSINTIAISRLCEAEQEERRASLSPNANRRLNYIEKIQSKFAEAKDKDNKATSYDSKVILAIDALQHSFNEISDFKRQSLELSQKYYAVNCKQLQNFQVLSYDYHDQIDNFLDREKKLKEELGEKQEQISQLRELVHQSRTIIKSLASHLNEQKQLKESQWKNIIQYDEFKSLEKKRIKDAVYAEVKKSKEAIKRLYEQIVKQERSLMDRSQDIQMLEQEKYGVENQLSMMRSQQEETDAKLKEVNGKKEETEQRLKQIELQVQDVLFEACGGWAARKDDQISNLNLERNSSSLPQLQHLMKQNINAPSKAATAFKNSLDQEEPQLSAVRHQHTPQLNQQALDNQPDTIPTKEVTINQKKYQKEQENDIALTRLHIEQLGAPSSSLILEHLVSETHANTPMMPLEWLHQIKAHILNLQSSLYEEKSYFNNLKELLASKDANHSSNMRLEDQAAQHNSHNCFSQNADEIELAKANSKIEEPDFLNTLAQTHEVTKAYSGFNNMSKLSNIKYISSGANSQLVSPRASHETFKNQFKQQKVFNHHKQEAETLTQSLESFVKQNHEGFAQAAPECSSPALSELVNKRNDGGLKRNRHFETFNENSPQFEQQQVHESLEEQNSNIQMTLDCSKADLHTKLLQFFDDTSIKSKTIVAMRQELEAVTFNKQLQAEQANQEIAILQQELAQLASEQEQLTNVYEQENQMRQDLEVQIDQLQQDFDEAQNKIETLSEKLDHLKEENDVNVIEKQKMEQSSDYWQNSFKLLEQSYLEEQEKSEYEISSLQSTLASTRDKQMQMEEELCCIQDQNQELQNFRNGVLCVRENMHSQNCQTDETMHELTQQMDSIQKLRFDNEQIKRDIAVLIDSYDSYKEEANETQKNQKDEIEGLLKLKHHELKEKDEEREQIIQRLSSEIQEQISLKHRMEDELAQQSNQVQEVEHQMRIYKQQHDHQLQEIAHQHEQEQECLQNQIENLKDQVQSLGQHNETISTFNQQLLAQISNLQINIPNLQGSGTRPNILFSDPSNALIQSFSIGQFANGISSGGASGAISGSKVAGTQEQLKQLSGTANGQLLHPSNYFNQNSTGENSKEHSSFRNTKEQININEVMRDRHMEPDLVTFLSDQTLQMQEGDSAGKNGEQISKNIQMLNYLQSLTEQAKSNSHPVNSMDGVHRAVDSQPKRAIGHTNQDHQSVYPPMFMGKMHQSPDYADMAEQSQINWPGQCNIENDAHRTNMAPYMAPPLERRSSKGHLEYENAHDLPRSNGIMEQQTMSIQQNGYMQEMSPNQHQMHQSCIVNSADQGRNIAMGNQNTQNHLSMQLGGHAELANTSLGLDMCQQCIQYESQLQPQQDLISKVITCYLNQARKLTSICMEGSMLLRLNQNQQSFHLNPQNKYGSQQSSLSSLGMVNPQVMQSEAEKKTQLIRQAQQFFQKDISKFLNPNSSKQEKLFEYGDEMIEIAQKIIQNSCDLTANQYQSQQFNLQNLGKSSSLKIQDYTMSSSNRGTQTEVVARTNKSCQVEVSSTPTQSQVLSNNYRSQSGSNVEVLAEIECLGTSLDNKISTFVKLLMSLKTTHGKQKKDDQVSKLIQSLVGVISKMIHELTEDTRTLGDIKLKLSQENSEERILSYTATLPQSKRDALYDGRKSSTTRDLNEFRNESNLSDMPLQQHRYNHSRTQEINFVNEDESAQESESQSRDQSKLETMQNGRWSQRNTANFEHQPKAKQQAQRPTEAFMSKYYSQLKEAAQKTNYAQNGEPQTNETLFSINSLQMPNDTFQKDIRAYEDQMHEQQMNSNHGQKPPQYRHVQAPQMHKSENQPTNRTMRSNGTHRNSYYESNSNMNEETETDGQGTSASHRQAREQECHRYESNKIQKQESRNLNDSRAVENLIQDITSLYGQTKHPFDREATKQSQQSVYSRSIDQSRQSLKTTSNYPATNTKKSRSKDGHRHHNQHNGRTKHAKVGRKDSEISPRSYLNNVNCINQSSSQVIPSVLAAKDVADYNSNKQLSKYQIVTSSSFPVEANSHQQQQSSYEKGKKSVRESSRRSANNCVSQSGSRGPQQSHGQFSLQERLQKNREIIGRVIQGQQLQCTYQDSVQSAADLYQAPLDSLKHISTTAPRPPQPINMKPTSHKFNPSLSNANESLKYHSSKSIVDPAAERYSQRQFKSNLPSQPLDFGEHKFLHSFNANPHASGQSSAQLHHNQMRGRGESSSPVAVPKHVVSMADPSFHHQDNYFGGDKQTVAEHFQQKFQVNHNQSRALQSDARARSHENIQSAAKSRSSKQPLGRMDHNTLQGTMTHQSSLDYRKRPSQKKHNFEIRQ